MKTDICWIANIGIFHPLPIIKTYSWNGSKCWGGYETCFWIHLEIFVPLMWILHWSESGIFCKTLKTTPFDHFDQSDQFYHALQAVLQNSLHFDKFKVFFSQLKFRNNFKQQLNDKSSIFWQLHLIIKVIKFTKCCSSKLSLYLDNFKMFFLSASIQKKEILIVILEAAYYATRCLGALRAPTSSWRPFGPLDFVLRALRALRPCDPRIGDWIVC